MLKPNIKKLGLMAFAGFMTVGAVAPAVSVHAYDGTTPVTFDNRHFVPGTSEYGFIIPTAITFNGEVLQTVRADLSVIGINGTDLARDFERLQVSAAVQSKNQYKMILNGTDKTKSALYELEYNKVKFNSTTAGKDQKYGITTHLGVGINKDKSKNDPNQYGTAKLMNKNGATVKGAYRDTLTYSFSVLDFIKR